MEESDAPVFVIELGPAGPETASDLEEQPTGLSEPIAHVAIRTSDDHLAVWPITPTQDLRFLDALARLIRFADRRGVSVRAVAERYGSEYERRLLFERRLPGWALDWGRRDGLSTDRD